MITSYGYVGSGGVQVRLWTFGHGTASADELTELLEGAGIDCVVDVRSAPGSRKNPHVARAELRDWLPRRGIAYRWDGRLGGFRKMPDDSPDTGWRNNSFRAYAAHMRTEEFETAARELVDEAGSRAVAVMCSESVWWRCHRRMIADFVRLAHGCAVTHLMHDGRHTEHEPMPLARLREDGLLVYDRDHQTT